MMTREEAIKLLKQYQGYEPMFPDGEKLKHAFDLTDETVDTLLAALRGPTREVVERMFPGCALCNWGGLDYVGVDGDGIYLSKPSKDEKFRFCPVCGKPLTDEAVDMVMERLEALKDGKGD